MAADAKCATTPTCTATTPGPPTLYRMVLLYRMAPFVNPKNPAQMAVDAKSATTPICTATTPGPPILKPTAKNQKTNSGGVRRHKSNQINQTKTKYFKEKKTKKPKKTKNSFFYFNKSKIYLAIRNISCYFYFSND